MKFIPIAYPDIGIIEKRFVNKCLTTSWISSVGKFISEFESTFADFCGSKYAVSTNNGTTALHLALTAIGIKPGDEILVPNLTFIATANAVRYCGATPIFIDIKHDTWNIDCDLLEKNITAKTRAIMPVHLYGYPADMNRIMFIAKKYNLYVIEDAAEAHGAKFYNKTVGTIGDIGCFSFYGNKIITTGEGGMCITSNRQLREKMVLYKNHGMSSDRKYFHPVVGFNYRMTNIQAAIGLAQLKKIRLFLKIRNKIFRRYNQELSALPAIQIQPQQSNIESVCWLFSCLIKPDRKHSRDGLIKYLKDRKIDSRPFFLPITDFPMYKNRFRFPIAAKISEQGINLPTFTELTNAQQMYITETVKSYFNKS